MVLIVFVLRQDRIGELLRHQYMFMHLNRENILQLLITKLLKKMENYFLKELFKFQLLLEL